MVSSYLSQGVSILRRSLERLYSGPVRRLSIRIGLHASLAAAYQRASIALLDTTEVSVGGQTVRMRLETDAEYLRFEHTNLGREREIVADLLSRLREDDVFYDVGANVGAYTTLAASRLPPGQVVAFEPEPTNADRLQENIDLNEQVVTVLRVALSDRNGTIDLRVDETAAGAGEHAIATDPQKRSIEVETACADNLVTNRELPRPSVVKIDVEGAELSVLRGMQEMLERHCRLVYVEVHPDKITDFGGSVETVRKLLEQAGFQLDQLGNRGEEAFLRGSK